MLKPSDQLQLELRKDMNESAYASLSLMYLPLMGEKAYVLYTTLLSLAQRNICLENHELLMKNTQMSIEGIEKARRRLEEFLLLRSFYNEEKNTYLYVLDIPMKGSSFLSHEVFGRLFLHKMGNEVLTFYKQQLKNKKESRSGYNEVSSTMKDLLKNDWDISKEETFQEAKEEIKEMDYDFLHIIFDEKAFLSGLSLYIFPKAERTTKNLRSIAQIATIYGINEQMMKILIKKAMVLPQNTFDANKLKDACMKTKAKYVSENKDPYKLPPRRFLEKKQNGVALNQSDVMLIEKLICEYRLQPEVVNVLLETNLEKYDQKIVGATIERMAGSWLRLKIDTFEKAQEQKQRELQATYKGKNKAQGIVQEWTEEEEVNEADRLAMIERIKARRGVQ